MTLDIHALVETIAPGRLATIQALAADAATEEIRDARARHAGRDLLRHIEQIAVLHLAVAAALLRFVATSTDTQPGDVYERLTVLESAGRDRKRQDLWRVECSCGRRFIALGIHLRRRATRSCGCLRDELTADRNRERAEQRRAA